MSHNDSVIGTARVIRRNFGAAAINRTTEIMDNRIVGQWSCRTKESPDLELFELYKELFDLSIIANIPCSSPPSAFHRLYHYYPLTSSHHQNVLVFCPRRRPLRLRPQNALLVPRASRLPPTRPTRPKMLVSGVWSSQIFW